MEIIIFQFEDATAKLSRVKYPNQINISIHQLCIKKNSKRRRCYLLPNAKIKENLCVVNMTRTIIIQKKNIYMIHGQSLLTTHYSLLDTIKRSKFKYTSHRKKKKLSLRCHFSHVRLQRRYI